MLSCLVWVHVIAAALSQPYTLGREVLKTDALGDPSTLPSIKKILILPHIQQFFVRFACISLLISKTIHKYYIYVANF